MKITLLRHGNRDLMLSADGGLNQTGKELAAGLFARLHPQGDLLIPTHLICSPKKRAKETLLPLSEDLGLPVEVEESLDERLNDETSSEFRARVRKFLELIPTKYKSIDVIYLCSHADWLEDAMAVLPSDIPRMIAESGFGCGEHRSFQFKAGLWAYLK